MEYTNESLNRCFELLEELDFVKLKPLLLLTIESFTLRTDIMRKEVEDYQTYCHEIEDGLRILNMKKSSISQMEDTLRVLKSISFDIMDGNLSKYKSKESNHKKNTFTTPKPPTLFDL